MARRLRYTLLITLLTPLLFLQGLHSAPKKYHDLSDKVDAIVKEYNLVRSKPKCREFFATLHHEVPECLGTNPECLSLRHVPSPQPDTLGWTICSAHPLVVFQDLFGLGVLPTHRLVHNAIHESVHLATCVWGLRLTSDEMQALAYSGERACMGGHVGAQVHITPGD